MSTIIKLKDVWKTYHMGDVEVHALRGLSLQIKKGEFISIQGPSGSGKSTAMNMVGCLDKPTKGRIFLDNRDISRLSESDLSQVRGKKIGFIFQQFNLIMTMTALENVALPMMFQGVSRDKRLKEAKRLLKMVELDKRADHRPSEMSGGQQQRVAIARALINNPEVILADEPTGNLDSKTSDTVMSFLKSLHRKEGKTIIMVTHDPNTAKFADRVEYLHDGVIIKTANKNDNKNNKAKSSDDKNTKMKKKPKRRKKR